MLNKKLQMLLVVGELAGIVVTLVGTLDQIIKGDKRAAIAGREAGKAIANAKLNKTEDVIDAE